MGERDRTNTVYYDAHSNFGTPPKDGSGDYKILGVGGIAGYNVNSRKSSNPVPMDGDVGPPIYERVHTERRYNQSYQRRDYPGNTTVIQSMVHRSPNRVVMGSSTNSIHMPPMSTSYEYSSGRNYSGGEQFKPGPRASSAANIDSLFSKHRNYSGESSTGSAALPPAGPRREYSGDVYQRRGPTPEMTRPRDFGVVGAYSNEDRYNNGGRSSRERGNVRQHGNDYELDPRLNVTYPQYYVNDWKDRHIRDKNATNNRSPSQPPMSSSSPFSVSSSSSSRQPHASSSFNKSSNGGSGVSAGRQRFSSDSNARHLYEEVPMESENNGYIIRRRESGGKNKETAILDDYDNVPNEFLESRNKNDENADKISEVYQPGKYQPSEDAGSSSDEEDDPEYLDLMERDSIINRYEKGPDSADVDAWENPDFDVYTKLDRFGFVHKEGEQFGEANDAQRRRILKELSREKKWLKMVDIWKSGGPSKKMEDRIWKGIPEKLRLVVWPRLLGAERMKHEKKDVYSDLLLRARLVSKDIKQIDLDINRTYRDHLAFRKRYDVKQKSLLNVLAAYSMYNTEVGYCQGMSQIAALFLMYLDEEETFWCLHQLMVSPKHTMHGFFVPGFPKLQRFEEHFKKVLKKYKPRIYKHLEKQDIPYIYLTKWWFGCFLDRVPFSLAMRLWDVFLVEGDPILIAMALNIMKMHEKTIRKSSMETFMEFIQNDIANNFGYSDDETMHSLRETLTKLKSDRQHVPPPPRPEDLSEVPTKALGPILQKPMANIREEIHEIQSRRSRANSTGRSPYPKRKESARRGPPPVQHKWKSSQDSINTKEVPFEIPSRRNIGSPSTSSEMNGRNYQSSQHSQSQHHQQQTSSSSHNNQYSSRSRSNGGDTTNNSGHATPAMQRLRDEHNGQMVLLSRASDSEGDAASPMKDHSSNGWHQSHQHYHQESKHSSSSNHSNSRIIQTSNHVTRIELDGDISVI